MPKCPSRNEAQTEENWKNWAISAGCGSQANRFDQNDPAGRAEAPKVHCFRMVRIMVRIWIWITRIQVNTVKVSFLKDWLVEEARAIVYLNVLDITWSNSWFVSMRSCLSFPHLLRFTDKSIVQTANPNHNNQFHYACQQWTTCCRNMTLSNVNI